VSVFLLRLFLPSFSVTAAAVADDVVAAGEVDARAAVGGDLSFIKKLKYVVRYHFLALVYMILLSACFNTMGHGSFDLYPTFLTTQRKLSVKEETWVAILLQSGGISGAVFGGYLGGRFSLKWVPFGMACFAAPFLPLYALPRSWNHLALGAFFMQFGYGGAIGNLGNIFQQICPHPGMRAAFTGVAYNLGNAISSIAPTIETSLGERFPTANGTPDYATTQLTLVGIVSPLDISPFYRASLTNDRHLVFLLFASAACRPRSLTKTGISKIPTPRFLIFPSSLFNLKRCKI
jgi:SHS family lactate transporter-like MFS transporter